MSGSCTTVHYSFSLPQICLFILLLREYSHWLREFVKNLFHSANPVFWWLKLNLHNISSDTRSENSSSYIYSTSTIFCFKPFDLNIACNIHCFLDIVNFNFSMRNVLCEWTRCVWVSRAYSRIDKISSFIQRCKSNTT